MVKGSKKSAKKFTFLFKVDVYCFCLLKCQFVTYLCTKYTGTYVLSLTTKWLNDLWKMPFSERFPIPILELESLFWARIINTLLCGVLAMYVPISYGIF